MAGHLRDKQSRCQKGAKKGSLEQKNAGLKVVTLIATLNPVSQVLW